MRGRRGRWLPVVVVATAMVAMGSTAVAVTDTGESPLVDTIAAESIFALPGNARVVDYAFIVPDAAECEPLAKDLSRLDDAVSVVGQELTAPDGTFSLEQAVWELETTTAATELAASARPSSFLDCSRSTFDEASGTLTLSPIRSLQGPGQLLGGAHVFFASGGALDANDGTTTSFMTAWTAYDRFITRLATTSAGEPYVTANGRTTDAGRQAFSKLFDASTDALWRWTEERVLSGAEASALERLGVGASHVPNFQPTGPPTDLPECRQLVTVENQEFPTEYARRWQSDTNSFTQISRGFDTVKQARRYYRELRAADFKACYRAQYDATLDSDFKVTLNPLRFDIPRSVLRDYEVEEFDYFSVGGRVTLSNSATGQKGEFFTYGGASFEGSSVRVYFSQSDAPDSWESFVKNIATLVTADVAVH